MMAGPGNTINLKPFNYSEILKTYKPIHYIQNCLYEEQKGGRI